MLIKTQKAKAQSFSNTIYRIRSISLAVSGLSEESFCVSTEIFKEFLSTIHLPFNFSCFISYGFWLFHVQCLFIVITPKRKGSVMLLKIQQMLVISLPSLQGLL